ncbi:MAG: D-arabinono-1,4-lactone oxidase [Dehalococcoidales bacterium]|nr:D-arabinono-1,4-lactone oxidase [Dehalococcoidales bacterium]
MAKEWVNWSGSLRFKPEIIEEPASEEAVVALVQSAAGKGQTIRVAGSGHSSTQILETESILVSPGKMMRSGMEAIEKVNDREAWVPSSISLRKLGEGLVKVGLATHNLGDVDVQTVSGAISVGTHGNGKDLRNLSSMLTGVRLVNGEGRIVEITGENDPEFIRAARVSLGTFGVFIRLRLKLLPAFRLRRREWCTHVDECLTHLNELIEGNRNFDFYWYPRNDLVKLRTWNPPGEGMDDIPYAKRVEDITGWSFQALTKQRQLKFDEMEYFLPAETAPHCFQEVRQKVKERHRKQVAWRVLYRTVAPDDGYLSPAWGRQTATISLHQNASLPFQEYFTDIEPVLRSYGGRPHWAKKHSLKAEQLKPLYPLWDRFLEIRQTMDPHGIFLNPYLNQLLGIEQSEQR